MVHSDRPLISAYYYATYRYASIVRNVLYDQFSYLRHLDSFYGDGAYLSFSKPFPRYSALHSFIEFVVDEVLMEESLEVDLDVLQDMAERFSSLPEAVADMALIRIPVDEAFTAHGIEEESFEAWLNDQGVQFVDATKDQLHDYITGLRLGQGYEDLLWQTTQEVFFVVFQNRSLLLLFNEMMARQFETTDYDSIDESQRWYFRRQGYLRRMAIPTWAMKAVFFRDRGLCVLCRRDLTGLVNVWNRENFDHIVPLRRGGMNDVSNLQLLCRECNLKKSAHAPRTSSTYEAWYELSPSARAF